MEVKILMISSVVLGPCLQLCIHLDNSKSLWKCAVSAVCVFCYFMINHDIACSITVNIGFIPGVYVCI